jgi:glycerol uptake facilitator-like aquaporin
MILYRKTNMSGIVSTLRKWTFESRPSLLTKAAAEFTGCMIFHFLGSVSPTASTNAVALMVLVYYTAKLSGAHLNPALTMTFALLGYTNPVEVLVYWIAQVSGCIFGAMWISALVPGLAIGGPVGIEIEGTDTEVAGCFEAENGLSLAQTFGWEAVGTFCFILPIFSVVWYTQSKSGYGNTGPIIVGLSLYASASAVGQFTGGALNPARAVASAIVYKCPGGSSIWSYVAGEFVGAMVVPLAVIPWYGVSATVPSAEQKYIEDANATIEIPSKYEPTDEEISAATEILNSAMKNPSPSSVEESRVVVDMGAWRSTTPSIQQQPQQQV